MKNGPALKYTLLSLSALVGGAVTVALTANYLNQQARSKQIPILTAYNQIPRGTKITTDLLAQKEVKTESLPKNAIQASQLDEIIGKEARIDIPKGAPLLWGHLPPGNISLEALLSPGQKAVTFPAPAISPFLELGDRVDIISVDSDPEKGKIIAREAQTIEIREETEGRYFTVALSSKEAIKLISAIGQGNIGLVLSRNIRKRKKNRKNKSWDLVQVITGIPLQ